MNTVVWNCRFSLYYIYVLWLENLRVQVYSVRILQISIEILSSWHIVNVVLNTKCWSNKKTEKIWLKHCRNNEFFITPPPPPPFLDLVQFSLKFIAWSNWIPVALTRGSWTTLDLELNIDRRIYIILYKYIFLQQ